MGTECKRLVHFLTQTGADVRTMLGSNEQPSPHEVVSDGVLDSAFVGEGQIVVTGHGMDSWRARQG
jgi:hypothetical protein